MKYPGGPNIEKAALMGENTYELPAPMKEEGYNFSYSGLKSYVINLVHNERQRNHDIRINDLACSFQTAAVEELTRKVGYALKQQALKTLF